MNTKTELIGLTGYAQSGKDTVGIYLTQGDWKRLAFADAVRDAVYALNPQIVGDSRLDTIIDEYGWDAAKVQFPEVRRLLQIMGTEIGRQLVGPTVWIDIVARKFEESPIPCVITDVRFQNEADWIRSQDGIVVKVSRPGVGPVNGHASDALDLDWDYEINNWGTINDLYDEVDALLY